MGRPFGAVRCATRVSSPRPHRPVRCVQREPSTYGDRCTPHEQCPTRGKARKCSSAAREYRTAEGFGRQRYADRDGGRGLSGSAGRHGPEAAHGASGGRSPAGAGPVRLRRLLRWRCAAAPDPRLSRGSGAKLRVAVLGKGHTFGRKVARVFVATGLVEQELQFVVVPEPFLRDIAPRRLVHAPPIQPGKRLTDAVVAPNPAERVGQSRWGATSPVSRWRLAN